MNDRATAADIYVLNMQWPTGRPCPTCAVLSVVVHFGCYYYYYFIGILVPKLVNASTISDDKFEAAF
jgi:hypothetical protein